MCVGTHIGTAIRPVIAVAILGLLAACQDKTITIESNPAGAHLFLTAPGQAESDIGVAPFSRKLSFRDGSYKVRATLQDYDDGECVIAFEPESRTTYRVDLKREKDVTIETEPAGASIYVSHVQPSGPSSPELVGVSPLSRKFDFGAKETAVTYTVRAEKDEYTPGEALVTYEPRSTKIYRIKLRQDVVEIPLVSFDPNVTDQGLKLMLNVRYTRAYVEDIERSPNVKAVTKVATSEDQAAQVGPPTMSPMEEVLVYPLLIVEQRHEREHVVTAGQTLDEIAKLYDTSANLLRFTNNIRTKNLAAGTRLKIGAYEPYANIWKQSVGAAGKTRVTFGKARDLFPSFTPDGAYLVFSSNRTSLYNTLWRIKLEGGGGITRITNGSTEDYSSSVSRDGLIIAYAGNAPPPKKAENTHIWLTDPKGSLATELREGEQPQVSPKGDKILFVRADKDTGQRNIWVMNIDGSGETQLTQSDATDPVNAVDAKWSPDGKWIVYASDAGFDMQRVRNYDIWLMGSDGSHKTQLTTNGSWDDHPCWNCSGKSIYFRSNRGGAWAIWRFDPILPELPATAPGTP